MKTKNPIDAVFKQKNKRILNIYFTAGYPSLDDTIPIIKRLDKNEVDLIEVGIPYSDPIADGTTIQQSSEKALENGMSLKILLKQLEELKQANIKTSIILMGYLNPILQYGISAFCKKISDLGIAGTIIPDLPAREYHTMYKSIFEKHNLYNIFLITPQTTERRLKEIFAVSKGFIYMVSSASITGARDSINQSQIEYFNRVQQLSSDIPKLIGFGISNKSTFDTACTYANGAIIGSAFINHIAKNGIGDSSIFSFIKGIL